MPVEVLPFILGTAIGMPAGVAVLKWVPAVHMRTIVAVLLILFSLYNLRRPKMPEFKGAGRARDAIVGILNGVLGGSTGLGGTLPAIWCGLRGWTRDEQRAVFQPSAVATFLMMLLVVGGVGLVTPDVVRLFLLGLPALVAGTLLGWGSMESSTKRRSARSFSSCSSSLGSRSS